MSVQDCNRIKPAHNVLWIKFQHVDIELYRNMFIYEYMMVRVKQHKHKRHTLLQTTLKWELPGTGLLFLQLWKLTNVSAVRKCCKFDDHFILILLQIRYEAMEELCCCSLKENIYWRNRSMDTLNQRNKTQIEATVNP